MAHGSPRLYRKNTGVFFVRVKLGSGKTPSELRRSLRTKCPRHARTLAALLTAALSTVSMESRPKAFQQFCDRFVVQPQIEINGAEDLSLFLRLMQELNAPELVDWKGAILDRLRGGPVATTDRPGNAADGDLVATSETCASTQVAPVEPAEVQAPKPIPSLPLPSGVANPLPWDKAVTRYEATMKADKSLDAKTLKERLTVLAQLQEHLIETGALVTGFCVHEVQAHHLSSFMDWSASRPARDKVETAAVAEQHGADGIEPATIGPATLLKRISGLNCFLDWAVDELSAMASNPVSAMARRIAALRSRAQTETEHYAPFTNEHLKSIFDPVSYLTECRAADHFWCPIIGLYLGPRLSEVVTQKLANITQHPQTGIWYMDILPEEAKNKNSVRRLPITQPLIDLGFLEYVQHVKSLGAVYLFPHRDLTTSSARNQPSKNVSEKFARYLDARGLHEKELVFHSFRHTVITALQDGGTPLNISQQIVGHQAQDHAVRTGKLTREQARSVTVNTYTHSDIPRMNVDDPFAALKEALERCIRPPIDHVRLKAAAKVILDHVGVGARGFYSGWAPQNKKYMKQQLYRI